MSDDPRKAIVGMWRLVHYVEFKAGRRDALPVRPGCRRMHQLFGVGRHGRANVTAAAVQYS